VREVGLVVPELRLDVADERLQVIEPRLDRLIQELLVAPALQQRQKLGDLVAQQLGYVPDGARAERCRTRLPGNHDTLPRSYSGVAPDPPSGAPVGAPAPGCGASCRRGARFYLQKWDQPARRSDAPAPSAARKQA